MSEGTGEIVFDEAAHTYTRNGHTAPRSVTELISNHFPEFKPKAMVDKYFDNWKAKPHSKYYEVIKAHASDEDAKKAILKLWETNREEAARLGTATHKAVELLLGGAPLETCGNPEVEHEINAFLAWHAKKREQEWSLEGTELVVGWTDAEDRLCLGGSIDAIFVNGKGEHVLVDWKRTKDPFGPDEHAPFAKLGSGPASELSDTKFNKYALQLAVYAEMLKRQFDIDVGDRRYLVRLTKDKGAQEVCAAGATFDRVAKGLLRVAAGNEEEEEEAEEQEKREAGLPPDDEYDPDAHSAAIHAEAKQMYDTMSPQERWEWMQSFGNVSVSREREYELKQIMECFEEWGVHDPADDDEEEKENGNNDEKSEAEKDRDRVQAIMDDYAKDEAEVAEALAAKRVRVENLKTIGGRLVMGEALASVPGCKKIGDTITDQASLALAWEKALFNDITHEAHDAFESAINLAEATDVANAPEDPSPKRQKVEVE